MCNVRSRMNSDIDIQADADTFQDDGFCIARSIIPGDVVDRARRRFEALIGGEYETGVVPGYSRAPAEALAEPPRQLYRLYQAHLADRAIADLVTHPALGQYTAQLFGARRIQLWGSLLLVKPPNVQVKGNIGWHQDHHYFTTVWSDQSEVFFASIAVNDIVGNCGPVIMIRGSHRWVYRGDGDFYGQDLEQVRSGIRVPDGDSWQQVPMTMTAGSVSVHHKKTFHGSEANQSAEPRLSVLAFLRTERSEPLSGSDSYWVQHLDDQSICPAISDVVQ